VPQRLDRRHQFDSAAELLWHAGARRQRPRNWFGAERRIAELAAGGHTNREIASSLFVTPKKVEYHLRNAYRRLDIQTRGELPQALAGEAATA
jgi:DNA-binding NarL/FixJ family response regulator